MYDPLCSSQDATYEKGIVVEVAPCRPRGKKGTVKISKSKMKNRSRKRKLSTWRLALKVRASVVCRGTPVLCVIADNNNNDSDHIEEAFYAGVVKLVEDGYAREKLYRRTLIWKNLILRKWFSCVLESLSFCSVWKSVCDSRRCKIQKSSIIAAQITIVLSVHCIRNPCESLVAKLLSRPHCL